MKLIEQAGTGKSQMYLDNYQTYFDPLANKKIKLLELGIDKGGSLLLWHDFFKYGSIVGLDINTVQLNKKRIITIKGKQQNTTVLDRLGNNFAPDGFDIIIDDASHIGQYTKISFWHLFNNHLKPGGIYCIEDWRVGYWNQWEDGYSYQEPELTDKPTATRSHQPAPGLNHRKTPHPYVPIRNKKLPYGVIGKNNVEVPTATNKKRYPSHDYGMVGVIKQLMDELGRDMITCPERGYNGEQEMPKFKSMQIFPGQCFIIKS